MFQTNFVGKIKTHILCSTPPPLPEYRGVYEIMWKNIVEADRPQVRIWRVRNACCITIATDTHSEDRLILIVGVQLSSGNSAPNSVDNHHLTIPFEGGMHSFKRQGACVSRN